MNNGFTLFICDCMTISEGWYIPSSIKRLSAWIRREKGNFCVPQITKILIDSKPENLENIPDKLKIFANSSNTDFSDVASNTPTELVNLEGKLGNKIGLNISKFRKISELVLYFTREDAEYIQLNSIQFYGTPGEELFNVEKMKKQKKGINI